MDLAQLEVAIRVCYFRNVHTQRELAPTDPLQVTGDLSVGNIEPHEIFNLGLALLWLCCVTMTRLFTPSGPHVLI